MSGKKILVIDPDTRLLKTVAERTLPSSGFEVSLVGELEQGIDQAFAETPNLLLLNLPLDAAASLLERLVQAGCTIPTVLIVEQESTSITVNFLRLGVRDYLVHPFSDEDVVRTVQAVLVQASPSPDYRQLAEDLVGFNQELEERVKEFGVLQGIGRSVSSLLDLDTVLNRVTEAAVFVTGAEEGYLLLLDEETGDLHLRAAQNLGEKYARGFSLRVEDSVAGSVVSTGKPILLGGDGGKNLLKVKTGYLVRSLLNVPLKAGGKVIGVLGVDNQVSNSRFTLSHLRRLSALADMAATAVVNARQYTEMQKKLTQRAREVSTLEAVAGQLGAVTDFEVGARLALSLALKATDAEAGVLAWSVGSSQSPSLYVSQGSLGELVLTHNNGSSSEGWWDEQILQQVMRTGQPILANDLLRTGNGNRSQACSRLAVPMLRSKRVVGVINLESSSSCAFTQDDLRFVSSVADQIAIALQGTVLHEKAETERERLSILMEAVDNAVWLVDADLRLMAQNEVANKMLGWSLAEVIGRSVYELVSSNADSANGLCRLLSQAMDERQRVSFADGVFLPANDERVVFIGGKVVPIVRGDRAVGAICAFREILPERSDECVRLEFATMASHLLRTPLSFIQASVDLLLNSEISVEEQHEMLRRVRGQSRQMGEFVKELLDIARLETGAVRVYTEPVALVPLIERVLDLIKHEESNHVFNFSVSNPLPIVAADSGKTELILLNLLRSAVGRCPEQGQITIELEERMPDVVISIVDDGELIPIEQLDKVFWQFYPVDDEGGKMPSTYHFGLYTTRRLIELQNGRVWAQSQPGQGSRFSFSLPVWGVS